MHSFLLTLLLLLYHCGGAIVAVILVRIVLMAVVDVPVILIALTVDDAVVLSKCDVDPLVKELLVLPLLVFPSCRS